MVRQRADPGGARGGIRMGSGAGQEPDAAVMSVKSDEYHYTLRSEIVVDATETRHVVDEIRDINSASDEHYRDSAESIIDLTDGVSAERNTPKVQQATWFDIFDWSTVVGSPQNTTEGKEETAEFGKGMSPNKDDKATDIEHAARPVAVHKPNNLLRGAHASAPILASKGITPNPVVSANDLKLTIQEERIPISVSKNTLFQQESSAPSRKLSREEITPTSESNATTFESKPMHRGPRSPTVFPKSNIIRRDAISSSPMRASEGFNPNLVVSASEFKSRTFQQGPRSSPVFHTSYIFQPESTSPAPNLENSDPVISVIELKDETFPQEANAPAQSILLSQDLACDRKLVYTNFAGNSTVAASSDTTPIVKSTRTESPTTSPLPVDVSSLRVDCTELPADVNGRLSIKTAPSDDTKLLKVRVVPSPIPSATKLAFEAVEDNKDMAITIAAIPTDKQLKGHESDVTKCNYLCFEPDAVIEAEKVGYEIVEEQMKNMDETLREKATMTSADRMNSILSTILACIDPVPTTEKDSDFHIDIEKSTTSELEKTAAAQINLTTEITIEPAVEKKPSTKLVTPNASPKSFSTTQSSTPAKSNMIYDKENDAESTDGNLLDNDLESVPSVTEDVEVSVAPIQADDLGPPNRPNDITAALMESNVKQMKLPADRFVANLDDASMASIGTGKSSKAKVDPSVDVRRRLLIQELRSTVATFGRYDIRCANISAALGDLLDEVNDHDHALKLHMDAVTIYSSRLGDDHSTTIDAKVRLGKVMENAGQVEESINIYYQVIVMRRALRGDKDPSVADGLVHMAHALRKKGDYELAIKELKRALKVFRESLGDSHEKVAATVDEIASLYITIGDFTKSAAILEEVVKLKAATMGVKSKAVASTLTNLATAYECSEKLAEGMKSLKKAYKIYTEVSGYSSLEATTTLNRMAQLYEATNDPNRASVAYLGVLRGRKVHCGPDHLSVGETYFRLGRALRGTKQFDKALKCLKEALPIFVGQGVEMTDVEMVAEIMHEMAMINQDKGHFQDASRIFKQELSVRRKIGQPEYPFAARTLKHLGVNEYQMKNYSRALKYLVEALTIYQERGDQSVDCGEVLFHTGLVFCKINNKERALEAFVEVIRIFNDLNFKIEHPFVREANEKIEILEQGLSEPRRFLSYKKS